MTGTTSLCCIHLCQVSFYLSDHKLVENPGKTVQLLKASTKIYKGRQDRVRKTLNMSLKRFKDGSNQPNVIQNEDDDED